MPSLNKNEIKLIVDELHTLIINTQIESILEIEPQIYLFTLHNHNNTKYKLLISIKKRELRIHLINQNYKKQIKQNSHFLLYLKKYIENGTLINIQTLNNDRIIKLSINNKKIEYYLVFELFEVNANIYLLNKERKILYSLIITKNNKQKQYQIPKQNKYQSKNLIQKENNKLYNKTIEEHFSLLIAEKNYKEKYKLITSTLNKKINKKKKTINTIYIQLDKAKEWNDWQKKGELLKSSLHLIKQGQGSVRLINYFDPNLLYTNIELDKNMSAKENTEALFKKAKKLKKASLYLNNKISEEKRKLCELDNINRDFQNLEEEYNINNFNSLEKLIAKYKNNPLIKKELSTLSSPKTLKKTGTNPSSKDYMTFNISCDKIAYVGRNAKSNDKLSFSKARGNDLWLHTRDSSGSHVVVPLTKKDEEIKDKWLFDAALLALVYSKARGDAEVIYTRRKFVSKAKGLAPGKVYLSAFKTIFVRQDKERMKKIKEKN